MIKINEKKNTRMGSIHTIPDNWIPDLFDGSKLSFQSGFNRRTQSLKRMASSKEIGEPKNMETITNKLYWLTSSNPKTLKSIEHGYITAVMHLAPANYSGYTACKHYSQCATTCLFHQGRGRFPTVRDARIKKTQRLIEYPEDSIQEIAAEICYLQARLKGSDKPKLAIRLNCLSDIPWESITYSALDNKTIFDAFPNVQFYDYTKWKYKERLAWQEMPLNYHLTYSFDGRESDIKNCLEVLEHGHNVQMILTKPHYKKWNEEADNNVKWVQKKYTYHKTWFTRGIPKPYTCIDGDDHDLRFLDPSPVVLMGREKGYSELAV